MASRRGIPVGALEMAGHRRVQRAARRSGQRAADDVREQPLGEPESTAVLGRQHAGVHRPLAGCGRRRGRGVQRRTSAGQCAASNGGVAMLATRSTFCTSGGSRSKRASTSRSTLSGRSGGAAPPRSAPVSRSRPASSIATNGLPAARRATSRTSRSPAGDRSASRTSRSVARQRERAERHPQWRGGGRPQGVGVPPGDQHQDGTVAPRRRGELRDRPALRRRWRDVHPRAAPRGGRARPQQRAQQLAGRAALAARRPAPGWPLSRRRRRRPARQPAAPGAASSGSIDASARQTSIAVREGVVPGPAPASPRTSGAQAWAPDGSENRTTCHGSPSASCRSPTSRDLPMPASPVTRIGAPPLRHRAPQPRALGTATDHRQRSARHRPHRGAGQRRTADDQRAATALDRDRGAGRPVDVGLGAGVDPGPASTVPGGADAASRAATLTGSPITV